MIKMKRLHLRLWVKVLIILVIFIGLFTILNNQYKNGVEKCVNAGNSISYCKGALK